ncbi:hypothetical protein FACS1894139_11490 [Planctomycetales bacterium]|nr:hypothetical protein FACS1894107_02440 [Planctomycetales bacterium]GHS99437.1 hypothetical protein FACS1894108_09420 [Planctomycetales bacterium]GHT06204.1 hypothetical protein FACS1894139_11490 [Planctomycetales bacterium]
MNQRLSQKEIKEFSARLADARSQAKTSGQEAEKLVEGAYHDVFLRYFKRNYDTVKLTAPHQTDGLIEVGDVNLFAQIAIRLLIETKFDLRLSVSKGNRCKVIAQLIYYLKKFEQSGDSLPNVLLVGDVNNMFVLYTAAVAAYLQNDYDWTIAPSAAYKEEKLFGELLNDKNLSPYVYEIRSPHFDLHYVFSSIEQLAQNGGVIEKIKVGDEILLKAFLEFQRVVYKGIVAQTKEQMSVFVLSLLGDADVYLHPNKPNVLKVREKEIRLNGADYLTYFSRYDKSNYTLDEQKRITAIADRLIAELDRRFTGDYWTPVLWANEAHNLIGTELGADWRQKYVVWDCACGTKNLTRDYHDFAELYCSTLHPEELEIASDYNPKATTFQYDFLNDDIALHKYELAEVAIRGWKLPPALLRALLAKKPVVLFTNPPYGQPTNATAVTSGTGNKSRQIVGGGGSGRDDLGA